jgi:hypothetical protein
MTEKKPKQEKDQDKDSEAEKARPAAPAIDGEIDGVQTPNPISDPSQKAPKED